MDQLLDALINLDPAGPGVLLLCAVTAAVLGVLIIGGFAALRPPELKRRRAAERPKPAGIDLDLVALWRLNRSLQKGLPLQPNASHLDPPARTTL